MNVLHVPPPHHSSALRCPVSRHDRVDRPGENSVLLAAFAMILSITSPSRFSSSEIFGTPIVDVLRQDIVNDTRRPFAGLIRWTIQNMPIVDVLLAVFA